MLIGHIKLFFFLFLIFPLIEGCRKNDDIFSDLLKLNKPENFQQKKIVIDDILKKYIYIGMLDKDAISLFKNKGFAVYEKDVQNPVQKILRAVRHVNEEGSFSALTYYKVVVDISFIGDKVSGFSGVYIKAHKLLP